MISPIFGGDNSAPSTSAINFNFINAQSLSAFSATENTRDIAVTSAMTLSNLYAAVDTAPGGAASYTFTVYKNGSATALSAVISGASTAGTDNSNSVSFSIGDTISMSVTPASTPVGVTFTMWNMQCSATGQPVLGGHSSSLLNSSTTYIPIQSAATNTAIFFATEADATEVMPTSGTFNNFGVTLSGSPGGVTSYAFTLVVNGVDSALTFTITGASVSGSDTTHSVSVSAGDTISLKVVPTGSPSGRVPNWGLLFTPTVDGESFFGYGTNANPSASATNYEQILGVGSNSWNSTESTRNNIIVGAYTLKKLYVKVPTAPGAGKSFTYTVRKAATNTSLAVTISDAATSGNVAVDTAIVQGDKLAIATTPSGTPTLPSGIHLGVLVVASGAPPVVTNSNFFLLMN